MEMQMDSEMRNLLDEIEIQRKRFHRDEGLDATLYNWGVVAALAVTGGATIVGSFAAESSGYLVAAWVGPLLSGLATIWVGIDRALQWGPRWMFNRAQWAAYTSLKR